MQDRRKIDMRSVSRSMLAAMVFVGFSPVFGSLPASAAGSVSAPLTLLRGAVSKLGSDARSTIMLSGEFVLSTPLEVSHLTVTFNKVLSENGGAGELLGGLPAVLRVAPGAKPKTATFTSATGAKPKMRLDIPASRTAPSSFLLNVQSGTIGFPDLCSGGRTSATSLTLSMSLDDGINPTVVVTGTVKWDCIGKVQLAPFSLLR
jgi:hypothetical protein